MKLPDQTVLFDDEAKLFRWFILPSEAYDCLHKRYSQEPINPSLLPFCPTSLLLKLGQTAPSITKESATQRMKDILVQQEFQETKNTHFAKTSIQDTENSVDKICQYNSSFTHGQALGKDSMQSISFSRGLEHVLEQGFVKHLEKQDGICAVAEKENVYEVNESRLAHLSMEEVVNDRIPKNEFKSETADGIDISEMVHVKNVLRTIGSKDKTEERVLCSLKNDSKGDAIHKGQSLESIDNKSNFKSAEREKRKSKWFSPPKIIFKPTVSALKEYKMLQDGDRVLICLSGGKDSLSLLHTIHQYQFHAKRKGINFEFGAVTIDPQTPSYDPSPLKEYLASLDVPYFYESQCIMETANNLPYECASICSFCSRMKRGRIYATARREGYNVLALGQHLDDLAESFMMSFLHNGTLNTMKAHYTVKESDLRVIRPFVYVREIDLRNFAEKNKLPIIAENCPACFEAPKERHRIKQLLAAQEVMFPQVYNSMLSAMKPLMARERQGGLTKSQI